MWSVRRAGIGVTALLIVLSGSACEAESASAPTTSAQQASRITTPIPIAASVTPPVPSAVPTGLSIPALGLDAVVQEMAASECPVLNPPTVDEAYWVGCRSKPGTDSDGTVFIIGHAVAGGQGVFARLQQLVVGNDVLVTTPSGMLTYRVGRTVNYVKFGEVQDSPEVMEKVPGRLVLVTCLLAPDGRSTDKNFVAQAQLVASATNH
jgi:sortase (surface protein transpeptidase)